MNAVIAGDGEVRRIGPGLAATGAAALDLQRGEDLLARRTDGIASHAR